jgi:hypothetical protein
LDEFEDMMNDVAAELVFANHEVAVSEIVLTYT